MANLVFYVIIGARYICVISLDVAASLTVDVTQSHASLSVIRRRMWFCRVSTT